MTKSVLVNKVQRLCRLKTKKMKQTLVKVEAGLVKVPATSENASTTNMVLMSTENISSVNLVRYLTKLDPDVIAAMNRMAAVHRPVQAYNGRNGTLKLSANGTIVATNARTGPVDPMIVSGWAAVSAYMIPQKAVDDTISIVPMAPFVAIPNRLPNPMAGARQAKKRNNVAAKHCTVNPSMISDA